MPTQRGLASALAVALVTALPVVHAEGRFPSTTGVYPAPSPAGPAVVRAGFGLLISSPGAPGYQWVCPAAVGYDPSFDPDVAITPEGELLVGTPSGLRHSQDGGCTWPLRDPARVPQGTWVAEVAVAADRAIWIATATTARSNDVYVDRGQGFESTGLATVTGWWRSLAVAPSRPDRIYVSGYDLSDRGRPTVKLRRSDDGGRRWDALPTADFRLAPRSLIFIAALSPVDPDLVFARVADAPGTTGDALYRSTDGGRSWSLSLITQSPITGAVVRRRSRDVVVATAGHGVRISSLGGAPGTFSRSRDVGGLACLSETAGGSLLGCGGAPASSADLLQSLDGVRWAPALRFADLRGPVRCPASTPQHQLCATRRWPSLCAQLGACGPKGDRP